jgi:anti-anti-sigma factor
VVVDRGCAVTTVSVPFAGFTVEARFVEQQAVLVARGEVDISSASKLDAFLDAVIVSGFRSVVLDLAELDFLDQAGQRVIAYAASRLVASGGELEIRSPSALATRILDITWLGGLAEMHQSPPARDRLGPAQSPAAAGMPLGREIPARVRGMEKITALSSDNEVVDGALRLVVALARATVGGADGVSVSLQRHGRLATVAASDQTISYMDANQYATGEGPCVDASIEGRWFHAESLDTETRWPAFTPRAHALGINSILSSPLVARNKPVGALNIYSRTAAAFTPKDQELAAVFATEASTILTDAGVDVTDVQLAGRFQEALRTREIIAQAQGVIMEREGVGEDDAYATLRRSSLWAGQPLLEWAQNVMGSTRRRLPHVGPGSSGDRGG